MNDESEDGRGGDRDDDADEPWDGEGDTTGAVVDPVRPSTENAGFVLLGALLALFVLGRVAGLV